MISKYEKTNGVKLFALVAVLAMVFAGAAVMLSDSGVDAANEPTRLSGAITATQNFGDGTEVIANFNETEFICGGLRIPPREYHIRKITGIPETEKQLSKQETERTAL